MCFIKINQEKGTENLWELQFQIEVVGQVRLKNIHGSKVFQFDIRRQYFKKI